MDLNQILNLILDTQMSCLTQQADMEAQLHALQIVLISAVNEKAKAAELLQKTFDEQRTIRREGLQKQLAQLALLRATVSTRVQ
jgi:hypothetical protein